MNIIQFNEYINGVTYRDSEWKRQKRQLRDCWNYNLQSTFNNYQLVQKWIIYRGDE